MPGSDWEPTLAGRPRQSWLAFAYNVVLSRPPEAEAGRPLGEGRFSAGYPLKFRAEGASDPRIGTDCAMLVA